MGIVIRLSIIINKHVLTTSRLTFFYSSFELVFAIIFDNEQLISNIDLAKMKYRCATSGIKMGRP